jgi:hypothetical protein
VLLVGLFVLSLVVAQTCQQRQVRVSEERAIATATRAVDFRPERTQVRLVRQGLNARPFWAVSLSVPARDGEGFTRLATARVDANTGKLVALTDDTKETKP